MAGADPNARLTPDLERTLRRFVLGGLDEPVRLELEEMLVTDQAAFEALGVVEDELVEEYLDGVVAAADRLALERHFLTSPQREARLRLARALRSRASRPADVDPDRAQGADSRARSWPPAWIGLAAALAVSVAGNVWLVSRGRPAREETGARPPAAAESTRDGSPAPAEPRGEIATFALAGGTLRAEGPIQRVDLPAGAAVARLRLGLAGDDYRLYRAVLLDSGGDELLAESRLKATVEAGEAELALIVPAGLLPRGDYRVKVTGLRERGAPEPVATYSFRVDTP